MSDEVLSLETSKFFRIKIRLNCACWNVSHCAVSSCFFLSFCFCQLQKFSWLKFKTCAPNREHDVLVKSSMKFFFQILWPSQKTQTLFKSSLGLCDRHMPNCMIAVEFMIHRYFKLILGSILKSSQYRLFLQQMLIKISFHFSVTYQFCIRERS